MDRQELIEVCAWNVACLYDPYELADADGDEWELFCETCWLLEENPQAVLDWLMEA